MSKREHVETAQSARLAFIGAGNMATCMIGGLVDNGYPNTHIMASDANPEALDNLTKRFGIAASGHNIEACAWAQIVVLAVKPQVMATVAADIRPALGHRPLVISIAAGINSRQLQRWLGSDTAIIRTMPNTPALVQTAATGLYANAMVNRQQRAQAEVILNAIGCITWVDDESLIDSVTAVSGSGPAYFFLLMEAMIEAGVKQGLTRATAEQLTRQTALGAAEMARTSDTSVAELRRRVTSPGGTTERAMRHFQEADFVGIVTAAMDACAKRSRQLAQQFEQ